MAKDRYSQTNCNETHSTADIAKAAREALTNESNPKGARLAAHVAAEMAKCNVRNRRGRDGN